MTKRQIKLKHEPRVPNENYVNQFFVKTCVNTPNSSRKIIDYQKTIFRPRKFKYIYFSTFPEHIQLSYFCDIHLLNTSNKLSRQFHNQACQNKWSRM